MTRTKRTRAKIGQGKKTADGDDKKVGRRRSGKSKKGGIKGAPIRVLEGNWENWASTGLQRPQRIQEEPRPDDIQRKTVGCSCAIEECAQKKARDVLVGLRMLQAMKFRR